MKKIKMTAKEIGKLRRSLIRNYRSDDLKFHEYQKVVEWLKQQEMLDSRGYLKGLIRSYLKEEIMLNEFFVPWETLADNVLTLIERDFSIVPKEKK